MRVPKSKRIMCDQRTIIVADSCAGGFAVLRNLLECAENNHFIYLCDGGKNPFGLKNQDEIQDIVVDWLRFAQGVQASVLVVACNTASAAIQPIRKELERAFNIPVISLFDAARMAFCCNSSLIEKKRLVLFGTQYTISSHLLDNEIKKYNPRDIQYIVGTNAERLVARGKMDSIEDIVEVEKELELLNDASIDTIVLACTCFEFLINLIHEIHPKIGIININEHVPDLLPFGNNSSPQRRVKLEDVDFLTTGDVSEWAKNLNAIIRMARYSPVNVRGISIH